MNITVNVDEVTLQSLIREATEYSGPHTVGDEVASQIVTRILSDHDLWPPLRDKVTEVRDEVIREKVTPLIAETFARTLTKTNVYGEATGQTTTLSEVIVAEAKRIMTQPNDSYSRSRRTVLQEMVADEVKRALGAEIADAVKKARELVSGQIGDMVSAAVAEGLRKR